MIILGGGVMHQEQLFPLIRKKLKEYINGYIVTDELADMEHYVVPASLHDDQASWDAWNLQEELLKTIIDRAAVYDIAAETSDMSCESSG